MRRQCVLGSFSPLGLVLMPAVVRAWGRARFPRLADGCQVVGGTVPDASCCVLILGVKIDDDNCPFSCFWRQTGAFTNVAPGTHSAAPARRATFQASSPSALSAQTDSSRSIDRHKIRAATLNGLQLKRSQESKEASATAQKKDAATAAVGQFLDAGSPG
ncbi:hypothetical protein IWZ00DRAFT_39409 [Phyllosticta capitalensis]